MEQGKCLFLYDHVGLLTCGGLSVYDIVVRVQCNMLLHQCI